MERGDRGKRRLELSEVEQQVEAAKAKYARIHGESVATGVKQRKLKAVLDQAEEADAAATAAARAEILLTEQAGYLEAEGMHRTWRFKQSDIAENVDRSAARKVFDLSLKEFGPYCMDFDRSGRYLLMGGRKGHLAMLELDSFRRMTELHVREAVRDVRFLHNHHMYAVAQKKYTYIYDKSGTELHCLRHHREPYRLEFLPYHFLLASVGRTGFLKYQDVSTGQLVAELRTKQGPCDCMAQNPFNAVLHLGHTNGTVTLWSPNLTTPLVKMLCHRGAVTSVATDLEGKYMVTAGSDAQLKVWDLRTYKELHAYATSRPASSLAVSQRGLVAVSFGPHVQVWQDAMRTKAAAPYMRHSLPGEEVVDLHFRPFDDVLAVGHSGGLSSMLVPGAGEPNLDSFVANPYQTPKQLQEALVHGLLDKLQPNTIMLDSTAIGGVDPEARVMSAAEREATGTDKAKREKNKARGRNKIGKKQKKHQRNIITKEQAKLREKLERRAQEKQEREEFEEARRKPARPRDALSRFE